MRACTRLCRDCGLYIHRKVTFFIYFASISFALNVGQIKLTFFYFQEGDTSYHIVQLQVSNHPDKFQEEILYWSISIPKQILWSIHLGSSGAARWPVKVATKLRFVSLLLPLKTHTSRCLIPFSYFYCSKVVPPHPDRDHLHIVPSRTKSPFAASQRLIIEQLWILSQLSCDMYCIVFPSLSPSTWATLCQYSWADFRIGQCHQINLLCFPPLRFTWIHIGSWLSSTVCLILSFDICVRM